MEFLFSGLTGNDPTLIRPPRHEEKITAGAFAEQCRWLREMVPLENREVKLNEAWDRAFNFSHQELETTIEESIREREMGKPPTDDPPLTQEERLKWAYEWFIHMCPVPGPGGLLREKFRDYMKEFSFPERIPSRGELVRFLRILYFDFLKEGGPIWLWREIIDAVTKHPEDQADPHDIAEKGNSYCVLQVPRGEVSFETIVDSLSKDNQLRVQSYKKAREWILTFQGILHTPPPDAELKRYRDVVEHTSPLGRQLEAESRLRLRRMLVSYLYSPPPHWTPMIPAPTPHDLAYIVENDPHEPFFERPRLACWFVHVNKRIIANGTRRKEDNEEQEEWTNDEDGGEWSPKKALYNAFYRRWIDWDDRKITFLELYEIAHAKRLHYIDGDFDVDILRTRAQLLYTELTEKKERIQYFPVDHTWNEAYHTQAIHRLKCQEIHYTRALAAFFALNKQQSDIILKKAFDEENNRRQESGIPPLNFEEWRLSPDPHQRGPRESWITGKKIPQGLWRMVAVETTGHPDYRKIFRARQYIRANYTSLNDEEEESKVEKEVQCALTGKKIAQSKATCVWINKGNIATFQRYALRWRNGQTAEPTKRNIYPKLLSQWAAIKSPYELQRKLKNYVQRNKLDGDMEEELATRVSVAPTGQSSGPDDDGKQSSGEDASPPTQGKSKRQKLQK